MSAMKRVLALASVAIVAVLANSQVAFAQG